MVSTSSPSDPIRGRNRFAVSIMRRLTVTQSAAVLLVGLTANAAALPSATPAIENTYRHFGLFGSWAADCKSPAAPSNPHVSVTTPSSGLVLESHEAGPDFAINRYSVLSAKRLSATRLSVEVIFNPGAQGEERQKLTLRVRDGTRRTMFNQLSGGAVRVRNGVALADGLKTPLLKKCE